MNSPWKRQPPWKNPERPIPLIMKLLGAVRREGKGFVMRWGEHYPFDYRPSLQLARFEASWTLIIGAPFIGRIYLELFESKMGPKGGPMDSWGITCCGDALHLDWGYHANWEPRVVILWWPWLTQHIAYSHLKVNGEFSEEYPHWKRDRGPDEWISTEPFVYVTRNWKIQETTAELRVNRSRVRRRIFSALRIPLFDRLSTWIEIRFQDPVGETASTVSFQHEMIPGEAPDETLRRAARTRRL